MFLPVVLGTCVPSLALPDTLFTDTSSGDEQQSLTETRFEPVDTEHDGSDYDDADSNPPEEAGSDDDKAYALVNAKDTPDQYEYFKVRDEPPTEPFYTLFPSGRKTVPRSTNSIA